MVFLLFCGDPYEIDFLKIQIEERCPKGMPYQDLGHITSIGSLEGQEDALERQMCENNSPPLIISFSRGFSSRESKIVEDRLHILFPNAKVVRTLGELLSTLKQAIA